MSLNFKIPYYQDYISGELARSLLSSAREVEGVPGLSQVGESAGLETREALSFLLALYRKLEPELERVLTQRTVDRKFLDERVRACFEFNRLLGRDVLDRDYRTVLGLEDGQGRIVFGEKSANYCRAGGKQIAPLPEYLKGPHVTLFGPPDSAKMAINAMNAYHRKLPGEPAIVEELLAKLSASPMWGADDEDSKTPIRADLVDAGVNLTKCFQGTISLREGEKNYELAKESLSLPIKRFPGLALPSTFLFVDGRNPIPLHLYDFALHLFHNRKNPRALVFYVPKLENEEEARYIHSMISFAEEMIRELEPIYVLGTVRLMIVLENPRAILRAHEIMDALYPYFAGASLGWHDYLASTARLFREDGNYRIPVKADPNIVIKYIKASHLLLADTVGSRGGIKVGGMYGILPIPGDERSLQVTLRGYFKDVITQLKRDLTGFWVAHPDFVRLGLALVSAWNGKKAGDSKPLETLVRGLLSSPYDSELLAWIDRPDQEGLNRDDPNYVRSLIVADIKESDFIPNHHPEEVRYNVFQTLQYLTDWLSGNGCVALPTVIEGTPVRVMDDLATAERSRWEVWAEIRHGRVSLPDFIKIAHEEMNFIRRDLSDSKKIVQVKWDERTEKWYPIAFRLMLKLMTDSNPPEFATELLIPFTIESIRSSRDPWAEMNRIDSKKYKLEDRVARFDHYFEICGVRRFAEGMAQSTIEDLEAAKKIVLSFTHAEILEAASFHGDIGQSKKTLDARAAGEQSRVANESETVLTQLRERGAQYLSKFGFKFLISAAGRTGKELLSELERRISGTAESELENARAALWEITEKRMNASPRSSGALLGEIERLRLKHGVVGLSLSINEAAETQDFFFGESEKGKSAVNGETLFEIASLSKTVASSFAIEYFREKNISLSTSVNALLERTPSKFRLQGQWADEVQVSHLMNHSALSMHYVRGISPARSFPPVSEFLDQKHGYEKIKVLSRPGTEFHYSGGGFLVLEHLIEALEGKPIQGILPDYLKRLGLSRLTFNHQASTVASGYFDNGKPVDQGRLNFPAFAAGGFSTSHDFALYLRALTQAFHSLQGAPGVSHDTAVEMLRGEDLGSFEFMGAAMGLGVFIAEAGLNRIAIHQGANEGFRALYLQCFSGPDAGKGFVLFANSDNKAVIFIAEVAQLLLREMKLQGLDWEKLSQSFNFEGMPQEQIVNLGYKRLIFDAFIPDLPEEIVKKGERDPLSGQNLVVEAKILSCTNQRFARAENLISEYLPIFDPELFGLQGKTMDSWESVRHNPRECDQLVLELKEPSHVRYVSLSTMFHDGNHPEFVSVEGLNRKKTWISIVPKTKMEGHSLWRQDLGKSTEVFTQIRVSQFPDGGLSRLQLFSNLPTHAKSGFTEKATSQRFGVPIPKTKKPLSIPYRPTPDEVAKNTDRARGRKIDFASLAYGGSVVKASNEHYGPAAQVVSPFPPINMFDGMESARSRKPGHSEEVVIKLGKRTKIDSIVLDFTFFVNNNPLEVSIESFDGKDWVELVGRTRVKKFAGNQREFKVLHPSEFHEVRVRTFPDGGINRIKVYGPAPAV